MSGVNVVSDYPRWLNFGLLDSPILKSSTYLDTNGNLNLLLMNNVLPKDTSKWSTSPSGGITNFKFDPINDYGYELTADLS